MDPMMMLGAGLVAGLALAMPLGAIGVLLVQEGASRGFRRGIPSAVAVATVDALYCIAAVTAGSVLAPVIAGAAPWPAIVGGVALVAVAARGLLRTVRDRADPSAAPAAGSARRRFALFFGLTVVNPATLLAFAAIAAGLGSLPSSTAGAAAFVIGVAVASLGWQALLVAVGSALRWKAGGRTRLLTGILGNGTVGVLGSVMIVAAIAGAIE